MTAANGDRATKLGAVALLATAAAGVVLLAIAVVLYPGGTVFDRGHAGHSFWLNHLCDLTNVTALDGQLNEPGAAIARAAMLAFAATLGMFWSLLPALFPAHQTSAWVVRITGTISAVGLAIVTFVHTGTAHALAVLAASIPGIIAGVIGCACTVLYVRGGLLRVLAPSTLIVGVADAVVYARKVIAHPTVPTFAVPILQRVAFLLMLGWMIAVAITIFRRGPIRSAGPEPAR